MCGTDNEIPVQGDAGRTGDASRALDLEVALRVEGYRWVEWDHTALAETPLDSPGRFVAPANGLLSHLQVDASPSTALAAEAYGYLKPYSTDPALALRVAEEVGLFSRGRAELSRLDSGRWRLRADGGIALEDQCVSRLLCRATLAYLDAGDEERSP